MDNTTNSLAEKSRLRQMIDSYGVPRMIITGFLLLMFVLVPFAGVDFATQISNVINRFSWNAIMVLAMVPMVHSGCGLNFGLPLGIISGLLGATLSIELGFTGRDELRHGHRRSRRRSRCCSAAATAGCSTRSRAAR